MVQGGASYPSGRHRGSGDWRRLSNEPALSGGIGRTCPRRVGTTGWSPDRPLSRRACDCRWTQADVSIGRQWARQSDCCLVQVTESGRPVVYDGEDRYGAEMGKVLGRASL
jgi:hypothetical protein